MGEALKKECTFRPQINKKKLSSKRRSNSAGDIMEKFSKEN